MRALFILALVINIAWSGNIVCKITDAGSGGAAESVCSADTPFCHRYTDNSGGTIYGCNLCPQDVNDCEQCVGNDAKACNDENSPVGPKCSITLVAGQPQKAEAFCAAGTTLCYSPSNPTSDVFTEYGCGWCPADAGSACTICVGESGKACNAMPMPDAIICEVTTLLGPIMAECSSGTPYCHSDKDGNGEKKSGCGLCSGTRTDCEQCQGSNTPPACNMAGAPQGVTCNVDADDGKSVTPVACRAGTTKCFTATVEENGKDVMKYGCGDTCILPNTNCNVCSGTNGGPACNKGPDTTTNEEVKEDEKKNYNHGNIMMLNTLLLPLLLALWV